MNKKIIKLIAMSVIIMMLVSSLAVFTGCTKDENVILIGVFAPTSGDYAQYGTDIVQSYKLAIEEINADGGVLGKQLKLYEADTGKDQTTAVSAANKIISKKVDFVAGGYTSGSITSTMQLFFDAKMLLLVSNANSTEITKGGFNQTFMINNPSTHAVEILTKLLDSISAKKVALIHQGDSYTKDLADLCRDELPKSGYEIVAYEMMEEGAPDVSAIVTAIINSEADFVYWCGYDSDGSNVIKQLRRGGYTGEICVGDGSASVKLIEYCAQDGEGVYVTSPPFVKFTDGGEEFIAEYNKKFNMEPGTYATLNYDTIYLLKAAIEKAGSTDTEAVRKALMEIEFKGLSGTISFNENREPAESKFMILQIKDGEFIHVTP